MQRRWRWHALEMMRRRRRHERVRHDGSVIVSSPTSASSSSSSAPSCASPHSAAGSLWMMMMMRWRWWRWCKPSTSTRWWWWWHEVTRRRTRFGHWIFVAVVGCGHPPGRRLRPRLSPWIMGAVFLVVVVVVAMIGMIGRHGDVGTNNACGVEIETKRISYAAGCNCRSTIRYLRFRCVSAKRFARAKREVVGATILHKIALFGFILRVVHTHTHILICWN